MKDKLPDRLLTEREVAKLAAKLTAQDVAKIIKKLIHRSALFRASLRKRNRIGHAAAAAVAAPIQKKGQREEIISELAKKHKVSERYIWSTIRYVRRRSPAEYFLINALRHGGKPRSKVIAEAKTARITTRTLERIYRKYGASSPGQRLRIWDLAPWAKKTFID